jgi:membrane protease YdiL (CAAX protease family)
MKKAVAFVASLLALAALAEWIILLRAPIDPWRLAAFLACLSLVLGVFVAFTESGFVEQLREWALQSAAAALGMPLLLLIPYFIFACGTGTFSLKGLAKLTAYIVAPTVLLLPDRLRRAARIGWRDCAAMLALAVPVAAHWLRSIWVWPEDLYFFRPLYSVCVGAYGFMVIRRLEGVGYRLTFRSADLARGLSHFVGFALLAIPLGYLLRFIHFHGHAATSTALVSQASSAGHTIAVPGGLTLGLQFLATFAGIYVTIAIPEEFLFRGVLQNLLVKSIAHQRRELCGLLIASIVFGAAHLHHQPVPNWRYGILATVAGIFYGNVYRARRRLSASAFTHALVDTVWHFWF